MFNVQFPMLYSIEKHQNSIFVLSEEYLNDPREIQYFGQFPSKSHWPISMKIWTKELKKIEYCSLASYCFSETKSNGLDNDVSVYDCSRFRFIHYLFIRKCSVWVWQFNFSTAQTPKACIQLFCWSLPFFIWTE